jgi:hypothetical protein
VSRRHLVPLLTAASLGLVAAPLSADAGQRTHVVGHCTDVSVKPARYIFFCADGGAGLRQATYTSWTSDSARGEGIYWYNDCTPSCAGGTEHSRPATFHLYRVVDTNKNGPMFSRIKVSTKKHDHVFHLPTRTIDQY